VKGDKAILRIQNFFQRYVDSSEQLVQIRRFVEGMNDFGDDLPFGFHALQIGHVLAADDDSFDGGGVCMICRGAVEPAPTAVLTLKPATRAGRPIPANGYFTEKLAGTSGVAGVNEGSERPSNDVSGAMPQNTRKSLDQAVRA
jgi:hypothetical protein